MVSRRRASKGAALCTHDYFRQVGSYVHVHLNPVAAAIVTDPCGYAHSGHREICTARLIDVPSVLIGFENGTASNSRVSYLSTNTSHPWLDGSTEASKWKSRISSFVIGAISCTQRSQPPPGTCSSQSANAKRSVSRSPKAGRRTGSGKPRWTGSPPSSGGSPPRPGRGRFRALLRRSRPRRPRLRRRHRLPPFVRALLRVRGLLEMSARCAESAATAVRRFADLRSAEGILRRAESMEP
jgi:hypothetical protein